MAAVAPIVPWPHPYLDIEKNVFTACVCCKEKPTILCAKGCGAGYCTQAHHDEDKNKHKKVCFPLDSYVKKAGQEESLRDFSLLSQMIAPYIVSFANTEGTDAQITLTRAEAFRVSGKGAARAVKRNGEVLISDATELDDELRHAHLSAPRLVRVLPLWREVRDCELTGDAVAQLAFVEAVAAHGNFESASAIMVVGPPKRADYVGGAVIGTLKHLLDRDTRVGAPAVNVIYLVSLVNADPRGTSTTLLDTTGSAATARETWNAVTAQPMSYAHTFAVALVGGQGVVLQSVYGHYSLQDWLSFETTLGQHETSRMPEPASAGWKRPLGAPAYRGVLETERLMQLADALTTLTNAGSHAETYTSITGVVPDAEALPRAFKVRLQRFCPRRSYAA